MSDVPQLTMRQKALLIIIEQHDEGVTREQLSELISAGFSTSRATILRDLNTLLEQNLIFTTGKGVSTRYVPRAAGALLRYFDLPAYFGQEPDKRMLINQNTEQFLEELQDYSVLFEEERAQLDELNCQYQQRLATRQADILKREQERFAIELAWKSSRIEGNTYSLLETEELIKTSKEAPDHSSEEARMILNHKDALQMISSKPDAYLHINTDKLLQIHSTLVSGLGISEGIRTQPVGITGTNYQPPERKEVLEDYLAKALSIANRKEHPVEAALILSALIAYLQPFSDGNKRTARLAGNAVLLAHRYAPLSYRSVDEIVYKESVLLVDEQHSLYWYKQLFLEQFSFTCEQYFR